MGYRRMALKFPIDGYFSSFDGFHVESFFNDYGIKNCEAENCRGRIDIVHVTFSLFSDYLKVIPTIHENSIFSRWMLHTEYERLKRYIEDFGIEGPDDGI